MSIITRLKSLQPLIIVLILATFLRAWAVALLPQDFDEPVYLQNAFDYASAIRSGDFNAVIDYPGNPEHPPFGKLLYTSVILALGRGATWINSYFASRIISAIFGILAVLFIGLAVDPMAAGMLAIHTLAVKYTSQVYLEAVPHALTIACVLAFNRAGNKVPGRWFWLSAVAFGISAASKYSYLPVILVVLAFIAVFEKKIKIHWLFLYGLLSLVIFLALDFHLWHDPVDRLFGSLSYHLDYSQSQHVEEVGYPWYQPFAWIFTSAPARWHPKVFFYYGFDGLISILAVLGIAREWKERRWLVIWLLAGIIFLLAWPTKWPQYALTLTPALVIMGAKSLQRFLLWVRQQESYWGYLQGMLPKPSKWLWLAVGAFLFFIAAIYLSAAIKLAVGRVGWSSITHENSFLPSNTIYALQPLEDGQMLIGTERGAVLWKPAQTTDEAPTWIIYTAENTLLPSNRILSLARDVEGNTWFGTAEGITLFDGKIWITFQEDDLGLTSDYILCIGSGPDGRIYAGTKTGASAWDGSNWNPVAGVDTQAIFSLAVASEGQQVYFGVESGVIELNVRDGKLTHLPTDAPVKHLLVDSTGELWAATSGAGLAMLEEEKWIYYRVNNSGIPYSVANWITEVQPGVIWIGTAKPASSGGAPASFDGSQWNTYLTNNSGASGAEVTSIAVQSDQVWIGTRTAGIDLFKLRR